MSNWGKILSSYIYARVNMHVTKAASWERTCAVHKSFHHLDLSIKAEYRPYSNTRNQCFILLGLQKKAYIETRIVEETKKILNCIF